MRLRLSQGTKSWLFGCHSIIHSYYVIKAWKHLYKKYPAWWQLICILLHDIGYCGKEYLTEKSNEGHADLGARIAYSLFGKKGWALVIGHSRSSAAKFHMPLSELEAPDDYSWILASVWWLKTNTWVEPGLQGVEWQEIVKKNWEENGLHGRGASFMLTKEILNADNANNERA